MFEKEPNIDIVFRNGLKNFEVLPPADVWDNIPPMPVKRSRFGIISGIAAAVAAVISLALIANWHSHLNTVNDELSEVNILSGDQQAVKLSQVIVPETVVPSDHSSGVVVAEPEFVANSSDNIILFPADEQVQTDFPDETEIAEYDEDNSKAFSSDEITVIASGSFTGSAETIIPAETIADNHNTKQHFLAGASLSPSLGFTPSGDDMKFADMMNSEKVRLAYSTGLTFGYKLSDRLTIHSGIGLTSIGQTIAGVDVFAGLSDYYTVKGGYLYSIETTSGRIIAGNTDLYITDSKDRVNSLVQGADPSKYQLTKIGTDVQQIFRYIELPVLLKYKVVDRKLGLNLSGGLAYGLLVDNVAYTGSGSDMVVVGHTEGVNPHNLSSQFSLGMEYNISSNISFNLEPMFRYYVTPLTDYYGQVSKPYSVGVYSGFFFTF